jgi:hypothetical protein
MANIIQSEGLQTNRDRQILDFVRIRFMVPLFLDVVNEASLISTELNKIYSPIYSEQSHGTAFITLKTLLVKLSGVYRLLYQS